MELDSRARLKNHLRHGSHHCCTKPDTECASQAFLLVLTTSGAHDFCTQLPTAMSSRPTRFLLPEEQDGLCLTDLRIPRLR